MVILFGEVGVQDPLSLLLRLLTVHVVMYFGDCRMAISQDDLPLVVDTIMCYVLREMLMNNEPSRFPKQVRVNAIRRVMNEIKEMLFRCVGVKMSS